MEDRARINRILDKLNDEELRGNFAIPCGLYRLFGDGGR